MKNEILQAIYKGKFEYFRKILSISINWYISSIPDDASKTQLILENCYGSINGNKDIQPLFAAAEKCSYYERFKFIWIRASIYSKTNNWMFLQVMSPLPPCWLQKVLILTTQTPQTGVRFMWPRTMVFTNEFLLQFNINEMYKNCSYFDRLRIGCEVAHR